MASEGPQDGDGDEWAVTSQPSHKGEKSALLSLSGDTESVSSE